MTKKKKTLYEILEISPSASLAEIRAAHQRLSRKLISGELGLSREDIDFKLKVIDVASHTLSDDRTRDAYDARLATRNAPADAVAPRHAVALQFNVDAVSRRSSATALKMADAIEDSNKMAAVLACSPEWPVKEVSTAISSSVSALKRILGLVAFLMALAVVIKITSMNRQTGPGASEISKSEEKVMLQEYYQTYGVRLGSRAEVDLFEVARRRKENEEREAALKKRQQDEEYRRFVQESKQLGDQVSADLRSAEERALYEEERKKQQLEQEKRYQEEAERNRLEEERYRIAEAHSRQDEQKNQQLAEDKLNQSDAERSRLEAERNRLEEERNLFEAERIRLENERRKLGGEDAVDHYRE